MPRGRRFTAAQIVGKLREAEAFVAEADGLDVETVRHETTERARMLAEYRECLIRRSRERRTP